jgi:serine phosphatase RsbU (regulator of sigma subunit)
MEQLSPDHAPALLVETVPRQRRGPRAPIEGMAPARTPRYVIEHDRHEVEQRQADTVRLERNLLPQPLINTTKVALRPFYRAGRGRSLLGGDFYDVVQTGPDRLELLIGDVCGHGVDEAALAVELRLAWRALILAGISPDDVLPAVEQVLVTERRRPEIFTTVAAVSVDLAANSLSVRLAGHPPPVLLAADQHAPLPAPTGLVLGIDPARRYGSTRFDLQTEDWSLLMYTDGLVEGYADDSRRDRLDVTGLCRLLAEPQARSLPPTHLPGWLFGRAEQANSGPLADDVAMLLLSRGAGR